MNQLVTAFLKIFFRNRRAMFFVIFLPAGLFAILSLLGVERIIQFDLQIPYNDFLLSGIIALALMQAGIYTAAYATVDYQRTQVLKRLSLTPLTAGKFLYAQTLARFIVAILQTAVLLLLGALFFGSAFKLQVIFLPLLVLAGSSIFLNLGILIASLARDYEEAAPYTAVAGLSLTFLGDVFFPVGRLPEVLQNIAQFLPLKALSEMLRYSLFALEPGDLSRNIITLLVWVVGITILAGAIFSKRAYK